MFIAFLWALVDFIVVLLREDESEVVKHTKNLWVRESLIFLLSLIMGYLLVYKLKKILRSYPLWVNFLLKSVILLGSALLISFVIQFATSYIITGHPAAEAIKHIMQYALHKNWLLQKVLYWLIIFFITQLLLIINEKYSPGVFADILLGRYIRPKIEKRIVMFIDLKDS
ncbi:MAG: hypothetical protein ABIO55_10460, partial [Ginsengibacter sp.]